MTKRSPSKPHPRTGLKSFAELGEQIKEAKAKTVDQERPFPEPHAPGGFQEAAMPWLSAPAMTASDAAALDLWRRMIDARDRAEEAQRRHHAARDKIAAHLRAGPSRLRAGGPSDEPEGDLSTIPADPDIARPAVGTRKMRLDIEDLVRGYHARLDGPLRRPNEDFGRARLAALVQLGESACRLAELQRQQNEAELAFRVTELAELSDAAWETFCALEERGREWSCETPAGLALVVYCRWRAEHDEGETYEGAPPRDDFYIAILRLLHDRLPSELAALARMAIDKGAP